MPLDFIYLSFILLSVICGWVFGRKTGHIVHRVLFVFLLVTFINESVCFVLKKNGIATQVNYNFYYYFRFPLIVFLYSLIIKKALFYNYFAWLFYLLSVAMFISLISVPGGVYKFDTKYLLTGGVAVVLSCIAHFYCLLRSNEEQPLRITVFFFVSIGFFVYFLGVIPSLGLINFLVKKDIIHATFALLVPKILSIFLYSLISIEYYLQWTISKKLKT
jgi:hypothetical protein